MKNEIKKYIEEKYNGKNAAMLVSYVAMVWMMSQSEAKAIVEEIINEAI